MFNESEINWICKNAIPNDDEISVYVLLDSPIHKKCNDEYKRVVSLRTALFGVPQTHGFTLKNLQFCRLKSISVPPRNAEYNGMVELYKSCNCMITFGFEGVVDYKNITDNFPNIKCNIMNDFSKGRYYTLSRSDNF